MSELSGQPLQHYLRDARLTAKGMRAAAEIARNFRPPTGCLVGELLEVADEIEARAEEIDRSNRE
jgi:hypothetical protein